MQVTPPAQPVRPTETPAHASGCHPAQQRGYGDNQGIEHLARVLERLTATASPVRQQQAQWRATDIGLFWPDAKEDTFGQHAVFYDKKQVCYREVELWITAIVKATDEQPRSVVASSLFKLLRGSAIVWYQQQLSASEQRQLDQSLDLWFNYGLSSGSGRRQLYSGSLRTYIRRPTTSQASLSGPSHWNASSTATFKFYTGVGRYCTQNYAP